MLPDTPKLTSAELLQLIEEARNAELCRDTESLQKILQIVWNIEETPNFDNYEEAIRAELLRLSGVFLSFYGIARNLKNTQLRSKDLLTNAIKIFEVNKNSDKMAEAKINLAFCYWNLGEVSECEAILGLVEAEFGKNLLHPVYLQLCINRLLIHFWNQDLKSVLKLIQEIIPSMQFCTDVRLQAMFHNQAGVFYRASRKYDKAVFHLNESVRFAKKANNTVYVAVNYNNLAFLYKEKEDYRTALNCISKSINQFKKIEHRGFLSHALDTKALIYLDQNKFEDALETVSQAIEYFKQGEDYRGLTDALWTKVLCLLRLGRKEEAVSVFVELQQIALEYIGEIAVKKFIKKFAEEVYILRHLPFSDEIAEFKKARVRTALIEANGGIGKAAKILGLKNHQALSEILNKQFPELLGELGFKRRAKRSSGEPENAKSKTTNSDSGETFDKRKIYRLILTDRDFSFDFKLSSPQFETFYFDKYIMRAGGIDSSAIVAVVPVKNLKAGMPILIAGEDKFSVGKAEYDEWTGIYFMSGEDGEPIPIDEENIAGEPIGFCSLSNADSQCIQFSRFRF